MNRIIDIIGQGFGIAFIVMICIMGCHLADDAINCPLYTEHCNIAIGSRVKITATKQIGTIVEQKGGIKYIYCFTGRNELHHKYMVQYDNMVYDERLLGCDDFTVITEQ